MLSKRISIAAYISTYRFLYTESALVGQGTKAYICIAYFQPLHRLFLSRRSFTRQACSLCSTFPMQENTMLCILFPLFLPLLETIFTHRRSDNIITQRHAGQGTYEKKACICIAYSQPLSLSTACSFPLCLSILFLSRMMFFTVVQRYKPKEMCIALHCICIFSASFPLLSPFVYETTREK